MTKGFNWVDYTILLVYLLGMVGMGVYFSRREDSTERFFLGGRSLPWWAVGVSVFGTQLSAITYISIPGRAFETDWTWLVVNLGIPVVGVIIIYLFLSVYRARRITSIYEFLEHRFGPETRVYGALAFVLMHVGRMAIILFLPALVLSEVTGLNVEIMILVMGILATAYTVLGGIEAVIWTDVVQVIVLLLGALVSLIIICLDVDGGFGTIVAIGAEHDKFRMIVLDPNVSRDLIWFMIIGGIFTNFVPYAADQTVVQRYFTMKTEGEARRCLWLSTLMAIPASLLFFFLGTALFGFYASFPDRLGAGVEWDRIFPFFLVHELPTGIAGFVIAAIFAASMSSLDSSLNSISAVCITDFYRRFMRPNATDRHCLKLARWITAVVGIVATCVAVVIARRILGNPDQRGAWDVFTAIQGLLGGGLAGTFCLGVFTKRGNQAGVVAGLVVSTALLAVVKYEYGW
ncbi:MAG: sodium:solute symporter, partial [bacterium]